MTFPCGMSFWFTRPVSQVACWQVKPLWLPPRLAFVATRLRPGPRSQWPPVRSGTPPFGVPPSCGGCSCSALPGASWRRCPFREKGGSSFPHSVPLGFLNLSLGFGTVSDVVTAASLRLQPYLQVSDAFPPLGAAPRDLAVIMRSLSRKGTSGGLRDRWRHWIRYDGDALKESVPQYRTCLRSGTSEAWNMVLLLRRVFS